MNESEVMEVDQMECDVCGERTFQEREGYYYCVECGTKKEQLLAVEISAEDTFNDTSKHTSQRTIKKPKINSEDDDITSWEFYNYVLRGFLQELLNMGAKPELKLMTLQVWAAYMRRMEVAFCKNNEMGLPKLNVRALQRDARIIYNHTQNKRKRERQIRKQVNELGDERANWREWRKTKRKLDESGLSGASAPLSRSVGQSNRSLKVQWSTNARRSLKKQMPLKHLDKHSVDSSGSMHCHKLHPKASTLSNFDRNIYCLNMTKLYVVLAISLNLVEDDIQLTDLLRLIDEEYLSSRNMLSYLPDNVAMHGKTLIKQLQFGHQFDKCSFKYLRAHIAQMSRFIDLNGFQNPDLIGLAKRYVLELNLPPEIASYVASLMDALPPSFNPINGPHTYPRYEARVMAYIVYVLKLMFGLDDVKERAISDSALLVNEHLSLVNTNLNHKPMAPLFVYTEWMQFVEMRKNFVAHFNESFAQRFGVSTQSGRKVDDFLSKERRQRDQEYNYQDMLLTPAMQRMRENICLIFETLLRNKFGLSKEADIKDSIEFQPSLTPAHSYFKRILLHVTQTEKGDLSIQVPEWMVVDHTEHQVAPFKNQTTELAQYLATAGKQLSVIELACQADYQKIGLFQTLQRTRPRCKEGRANCDIKTQNWIDELRRREKRPDFVFRQPVAQYGKQYQGKIIERAERRQALEANNPFWKISSTPSYILKVNQEDIALKDLAAIQVFDECHMDPLRVPLKLPRRQINLLPETKDSIEPKLEASSEHEDDEVDEEESKKKIIQLEPLLKISNFDCWLLHGYISKTGESTRKDLRKFFPCSFRWLLDTCAATIGVNWDVLYEQLLVLEVMFHHGIEDWNNHSNHLRLKYNILNKDINLLTKSFRDMW
ncbi:hypothetical protein KR215_007043 [Drosophila sulfurigaster]|uniref:TATA box-binding protein-associated factor RNA polymerase I subunit B n=1 Tax=Drosophila sulfurigaster albostrigata TaxID=89887 RepID=UPI002D21E345|nr:TATA box-binding protein-associated factor RNA polymerase I subunit B [Drosophila sulfurigaster albostrigata]KAH8414474.1 hypothetical protein KR215_007043 [Drosophila sulfurigaster]